MSVTIEELFRTESSEFRDPDPVLGDFDLAEEALQDAFAAAGKRWPAAGCRPTQGLAYLHRPIQGHRRIAHAGRDSTRRSPS